MQSIIFVILPTWAVLLSFLLPPSAEFANVNIVSTKGKQDVLKQPQANKDLLYLSGLSFRDIQRV